MYIGLLGVAIKKTMNLNLEERERGRDILSRGEHPGIFPPIVVNTLQSLLINQTTLFHFTVHKLPYLYSQRVVDGLGLFV